MTPKILEQKPPRDIDYTNDLFKNNRKKVKGILIGSIFIIPLVAIIFWLKLGDLVPGILWGAGIAAFFELFGVALMLNGKKAVELCKNGIVANGTVQKSAIHGNSDANSAGYILVTVTYREKLGRELKGVVTFVGNRKEIDLVDGDPVPVLYDDQKPEKFILYSASMGISTIGRAKFI